MKSFLFRISARALVLAGIFLGGATYSGAGVAANPCERPLQVSAEANSAGGVRNAIATDDFLAYLGMLLENQIIGEREIAKLIVAIEERGELINPVPHEETPYGITFIKTAYQIQYEGLQEHLTNARRLDQTKILEWSRRNLKEKERVWVKREETSGETQSLRQKMVFNPIEPGEFEMGEDSQGIAGPKHHVRLVAYFEMMSTPVTQWQYAMIMGENPSKFQDGYGAIKLTVKDKKIQMRPDNPVEMVNWVDAQAFLEKVNDLSEKDDPILKELIPDHQKGYIYRLPTEAEWEFVATNRGTAKGKYHFGDNEAELGKYGWFFSNADLQTHPVAELSPLIVERHNFYDLNGNVWEWVQDFYGEYPLVEAANSLGPLSGNARVKRGGSWSDVARSLRSANRGYGGIFSSRDSDIGFRVVRTR